MPPRHNRKGKKGAGLKQLPQSAEKDVSEEPILQLPSEKEAEPQPQTEQPDTAPPVDQCIDQISDTQALTQPQSEAAGKRKREAVVLTEEQEEDLAEWIRSHEIFYDKSRKDYKDTKLKTRLWQHKAEEIGHNVKDLEDWYRGMRTRFGRLSKTVSGQEAKEQTERSKWIGRAFQFLSKHVVRVPGRLGCSLKQRTAASQLDDSSGEESEDIVEEGGDDPDTPVSLQNQASAPSTSGLSPNLPVLSKKSKKASKSMKSSTSSFTTRDIVNRLEERIESSTQLQAKISSLVNSTDGCMSSRTSWGQWMTSMMQNIHEDLWDDFMERSFNLMSLFRKESQKLFKTQILSQSRSQAQQQQHQFPLPQSTQQFSEQQFQSQQLTQQQYTQQQIQSQAFPQQQYPQQRFQGQQFPQQHQLPQSSFLQQQHQHVATSVSPLVHTGAPCGQAVVSHPSQASNRLSTAAESTLSGLTDHCLSGVTQASPTFLQIGEKDSD